MKIRVRIGTSGWVYQHWKATFYPSDVPSSHWLSFYARHFDTVEINSSFYRLPKRSSFEKWYQQTPDGFLFAVKGWSLITHRKRLKGVEELLASFLSAAFALKEKLAIFLWQLPPSLRADWQRLTDFFRLLPTDHLHAVEFRHRSWWDAEKLTDLLDSFGIAHCIPVGPEFPPFLHQFVSRPAVYLRFHGYSGRYAGCFPDRELDLWAERIVRWLESGRKVFAYFNNDQKAFAVANARTLMKKVSHKLSVPETIVLQGERVVSSDRSPDS